MSYDFDPPDTADFWHGSELERMVVGVEVATDEFVTAVNRHSVAEAAYLRAKHAAYQQFLDGAKSDASAERNAEDAATEERIEEKRTEGLRDAAKAVMQSRLSVLSAAQTHARLVGAQT